MPFKIGEIATGLTNSFKLPLTVGKKTATVNGSPTSIASEVPGSVTLVNTPVYGSDVVINVEDLNLDFTSGVLDPRITFTRSTTGTYVNNAGVLTSAAINSPRFDYDPVTLALKGLLIEEQRTNSIRNNTMQGAVAGTPGTLPTNWVVSGPAAAGLARTIVGVGTENGINYIDMRFQGTPPSGSLNIIFENAASAATLNQVWAQSAYLALVGGSLNNVSALNLRFDEGSPYVRTTTTVTIPTLNSQFVRYSGAATIGATTTQITGVYFNAFCAAAPIDFTLRIGLPQLELGAFATSVIPTTTAAVTRAADLASMTGTNFSSWYNQTEGTVYLEAQCLAAITAQTFLAIDNGTSNNLITVRASPSNATFERSQVVDGGVTQVALGAGGYVATSINDFTFAYKANDFARSFNGSSVVTDTSGTVPNVNQVFIGSERGQFFVNGHIRRIVYYPTRLSNAELQSLSSSRPIVTYAAADAPPPLWTPAQISTALWLDAADASTITLNGSTVSQWADKSGNGRNVVQDVASSQPTSNTRTLNGLNVLDFNFTSLRRSTAFVTINTPWLVYSVITFDNFTGNPVYIGLRGAQTTHIGWTAGGDIRFYNDTTGAVGLSGSVFTANTPALVGVQYGTTNSTGIYNGAAQGSPAVTLPADTAFFNIGNHANTGSNNFDGTIGEIVFIQSAVSLSNRQKLEGYLAWKWGLQANLPVDHPYRTTPPTA